MRYIELNPVRASIVAHPSRYPWSSYGYNASGQVNDLIMPHLEYQCLGPTDDKRRAAYRQLFKHAISAKNMSEIREATNKAWVLGDSRFKQEIQKRLKRRVEPAAKGGGGRSEQFKINRV